MWLFLSVYLFSIVATLYHIYQLPPNERTKTKILEVILLYQLVFNVGITSFFAFIGFTFYDQYIAEYLNWPACPFEQEMANVNLAFGFLGILCYWYRDLFWWATVIGFSIWIFADGIHHLWHAFVLNNRSPGNTEVPLYTDLLIPIVLVVLLYLYEKSKKELTPTRQS